MGRLNNKTLRIPGAEQNFIASGFEYCADMDLYLISGYIRNGKAARIYVVESDGNYRCKDIFLIHNKPLKCRIAGICRSGNYVYIVGNNENCYVMELNELLRCDTSAAYISTRFKTGNHASFCRVYNEFLYIGEYGSKYRKYSKCQYTPGGDRNYALICVFKIKNTGITGINKQPEFAFSIRGKVTGISFTDDGRILLSVYKNLISSYIYSYNCQKAFKIIKNEKIIFGKPVIVYYLDKLSQTGVQKNITRINDITYDKGLVIKLKTHKISKSKNLIV